MSKNDDAQSVCMRLLDIKVLSLSLSHSLFLLLSLYLSMSFNLNLSRISQNVDTLVFAASFFF